MSLFFANLRIGLRKVCARLLYRRATSLFNAELRDMACCTCLKDDVDVFTHSRLPNKHRYFCSCIVECDFDMRSHRRYER